MRLFLAVMTVAGSAWCQVPQYTISTVAGNGVAGHSGDGGAAINASLNGPTGVATDAFGNLYIADYYNNVVRKVTPDGNISTVAGTGAAGYSGDGGPATSATMNYPFRLTWDPLTGNVYVAEVGNNVIRVIKPNGTIGTFAGTGIQGYSGDGGFATSARLYNPAAVAADGLGNVFIADSGNAVIREVNILGYISTVAGNANQFAGFGGDGGAAVNAELNNPEGIALGANGSFYIADQGNDRIRYVDPKGIIQTVAGNGTIGYSGDGGPATAAELHSPAAPMLFPQQSATGNLYFCDVQNNVIRLLMPSGTIGTVAGNGTAGFGGDGGLAASAELNGPRMVSSSPNGNLYVADFANNRIRLLTRVLPPPAISAGGVVSASSFGEFTSAAPGSWIEIYGTNLSVDSRQWSGSDFTGVNAPTSLDGTSVSIGGKAAYVAFINPGQVNVQVPSTVTPGAQQLTVTTGGGTSAAYNLTINPTEPGLDAPQAFNVGGRQYVVAVAADGSYVLPAGAITGVNSQPAKPGDTIVLYGVGFGPVTPAIPPGQIVQQINQLTGNFSISIGGVNASVTYAGLAPNYVGLYQFNVVVPQVPSGNAVPVTFTLGGVAGSQTLYTAVQ
jgi:uncharacterized protein (TIGR03437 family)